MIAPSAFVGALQKHGVDLVTGVPDSLLKEFCAEVQTTLPPDRHRVAPSEGAAVGLAIGHYLATQQPALVYLQNSGLGNIVNPVTSLVADAIYAIPMVLVIGWRGEIADDGRQLADEPQHVVQGRITPAQLDLLDIPYRIIDAGSDPEAVVAEAVGQATALSRPFALLVRKGTFSTSAAPAQPGLSAHLSREAAIEQVLAALPATAAVVSTTGMASREVFEIRKKHRQGHDRDFLVVGGMGHALAIATGVAHARPGQRVACIDGDGALLMHSGSLAMGARCAGLIHVVLNNEAHDSVGGQPTVGTGLSLTRIAGSFGYPHACRATTVEELAQALQAALATDDASFIEVLCRKGNRADLGRPDRSPLQNRKDFQSFLQATRHA